MDDLALGVSLASSASAVFLLETLRRTLWQPAWRARGIRFQESLRESLARLLLSVLLGVMVGAWWGDLYASATISISMWLILCAVETDLLCRRIPKEPCWAALAMGTATSATSLSLAGVLSFVASVVVLGVVLLLVAFLTRGGLGSGDVRFLLAVAPLAWWIGTTGLLFAILAASLLQAALRLYLAARRRSAVRLPFAPALSAGLISIMLLYPFTGAGACQEWVGAGGCI